jgi:diguanylate cyclase (GGDEF)-like protein
LQGEQTQQAGSDQTAADRRESGHRQRLQAGIERDTMANARDLAAVARDQAAAELDRELEQREISLGNATPEAAEARVRAAVERDQAAEDRRQAARDRAEAAKERELLVEELAASEMDALTGARARAAGLADLDHEIDRARRDTGLLAVAYVDIVGLKKVNDTCGHSAGDELLKNSVAVIRDHLRSYDAIVRLGGDEFLCIMAGASLVAARRRFEGIEASLRARPGRPAIKVGLASLAPDDMASDLIDRADAALPRWSTRPSPRAYECLSRQLDDDPHIT